jgi:methionyl-tRNA formyltransferase
MLPAVVWKMPKYGTFNLHASLLPQYRGAAPINHAIINGETTTGLTTFFLNEEIDKGKVILRESIDIRPDETAGELHDELMKLGNTLVVETIRKIENNDLQTVTQEELAEGIELKEAPKIFKDFCFVRWDRDCQSIYNHIRGLSPYPAAHTKLISDQGEMLELKIYNSAMELMHHNELPGTVFTDQKTYLKIAAYDGYIHLTTLQQAGKKAMNIEEFLRGIRLLGTWKSEI